MHQIKQGVRILRAGEKRGMVEHEASENNGDLHSGEYMIKLLFLPCVRCNTASKTYTLKVHRCYMMTEMASAQFGEGRVDKHEFETLILALEEMMIVCPWVVQN